MSFDINLIKKDINKHHPFNMEVKKDLQQTSSSVVFEAVSRQLIGRERGLLQVFPCDSNSAYNLETIFRNVNSIGHGKYIMYPEFVNITEEDRHYIVVFSRAAQTSETAKLKERDIAVLGGCIAAALKSCHNSGIAHRNIKPSAIYATNSGTFLLGRFENSASVKDSSPAGRTPLYRAPELKTPTASAKSTLADIYALGMTMYALLMPHKMPIDTYGTPTPEIIARNTSARENGIPLPAINSVNSELMSIILKACALSAQDRYQTADDMIADINNFLIRSYGDKKLADCVAPAKDTRKTQIVADLEEKTSFSSGWEFVRMLGSGSFGFVFEAVGKKGKFKGNHYAIKCIPVPNSYSATQLSAATQVKSAMREIEFQQEFKYCKNVVQVLETQRLNHSSNPDQYYILIAMELLEPLNKVAMTEKNIVKLGIDICTALSELHKRHDEDRKPKIHRDIKPANILYSIQTNSFKLGDFGITREVSDSLGLSVSGTPSYMAPEYRINNYNHTVDIYALGITMYELGNNGRIPFLAQQLPSDPREINILRNEAVEKRLSPQQLPIPPAANLSPQTFAVIKKACSYFSDGRYQQATDMKTDLEKIYASL